MRTWLAVIVSLSAVAVLAAAADTRRVRITWDDAAPIHERLRAAGIASDTFASYIDRLRESNVRRVREGDLDHLVFYLLQSTRFTSLPPIEPALSAKALVDGAGKVSGAVTSRLGALLRAIDSPGGDARLQYFRALIAAAFPERARREAQLTAEYLRVMKFVYEKEFVAQRSERPGEAVAALYRTRGLSTDTAVEAGFLVYQALGVLRALGPQRQVCRILLVGPGLDLAPRTAMLEAGPPESYQPWTLIDGVLSLGLCAARDLQVVAADINPRVVEHLRRAQGNPPTLTLVSEMRDTDAVTLSDEFREYFSGVGRSIGSAAKAPGPSASGHLFKTIEVRGDVARTLRAEALDLVTERLDTPPFDLIVATNILPYFDDAQLALALTNIAAMLTRQGFLLHNEARPVIHGLSASLGLPLEQARHAVVASVRGVPAPLVDSFWLHRKNR